MRESAAFGVMRIVLARTTFLVALAAGLPGCHLLIQLGEKTQAKKPVEKQSAPNSGPETPKPPLPGLDDNKNVPKPPKPGLGNDLDSAGLDSSELILDGWNPRGSYSIGSDFQIDSNEKKKVRSLSANRKTSKISSLWEIRKRLSGNTGINTNTAIAPGEGQYVYRSQLRFLKSNSSLGSPQRDVNVLVSPQVLAYGVRENLTIFGVLPLVKRTGTARPHAPPGAFRDLDDFGVGDMRFFAKYRLFEEDQEGETTRWSVFGGLEVPSFDKNFSSDSWDPFLGTVWTYQSLSWGLDLDWFWNFNTGRGVFGDDEMRYDMAYTYVLIIGQTVDEKFWQLNTIFEINGSYLTDGSHLVYVAPGLQLALPRIIVEASLQLPAVRDLKRGLEPDFTFVVGSRITW